LENKQKKTTKKDTIEKMDTIAVRPYHVPIKVKEEKGKPRHIEDRTSHSNTVLVFDTETTVDELQNLTFGSYQIWTNGQKEAEGLFHSEDLSTEKVDMIRQYAESHGFSVFARQEFVDTVFLPRVYEEGAMCMSYNLPFDLSRLAIHAADSKRQKGGFSLAVSNPPRSAPHINEAIEQQELVHQLHDHEQAEEGPE
jgi:hypothetical protein